MFIASHILLKVSRWVRIAQQIIPLSIFKEQNVEEIQMMIMKEKCFVFVHFIQNTLQQEGMSNAKNHDNKRIENIIIKKRVEDLQMKSFYIVEIASKSYSSYFFGRKRIIRENGIFLQVTMFFQLIQLFIIDMKLCKTCYCFI